jgi:Flp pilus assembly protein TadB
MLSRKVDSGGDMKRAIFVALAAALAVALVVGGTAYLHADAGAAKAGTRAERVRAAADAQRSVEATRNAAVAAQRRPKASGCATGGCLNAARGWSQSTVERKRDAWLRRHPGYCAVGTTGAVAPC